MKILTQKLNPKAVLIIAFIVYFSVLLINDGFMALDEYWVGITRYIPAQTSSVMKLVTPDDVKSPLQLLPMHVVAQTALGLGITSPYWQYRFVILVLGLISILVLGFAFVKYARVARLGENETSFLFLMMIFYFAGPFSITRPMFESVSAPWLTLAAVLAFSYDLNPNRRDLIWGVLFASLSFVLRQQLGICALVFIILPILKRRWKDLFWAGGVGLICFILSGIPDYFIRGQFHFSLLNLTVYNYQHGSEYGNQSILFYPALLFVITLFPFFIKKYPQGFLKKNIREQRSLYMVLGLFVILHSLFPNKWERFIISVVPLLILMLYPFLQHLQTHFKENRIRLYSLYILNFLIFIVASFFPAQKNLIDMSLYLDHHPEFKKIHRIDETPGWITEAFILNKNFTFIESNRELLKQENWADCGNAFVVGEPMLATYSEITDHLHLKAEFNVNLIEQLAFKLNPKKNPRRVRLYFYSGCE
ncbi:MAG: hypothetical protein ACXWQQ_13025 [Pseudobdellovibrio sp.]